MSMTEIVSFELIFWREIKRDLNDIYLRGVHKSLSCERVQSAMRERMAAASRTVQRRTKKWGSHPRMCTNDKPFRRRCTANSAQSYAQSLNRI